MTYIHTIYCDWREKFGEKWDLKFMENLHFCFIYSRKFLLSGRKILMAVLWEFAAAFEFQIFVVRKENWAELKLLRLIYEGKLYTHKNFCLLSCSQVEYSLQSG